MSGKPLRCFSDGPPKGQRSAASCVPSLSACAAQLSALSVARRARRRPRSARPAVWELGRVLIGEFMPRKVCSSCGGAARSCSETTAGSGSSNSTNLETFSVCASGSRASLWLQFAPGEQDRATLSDRELWACAREAHSSAGPPTGSDTSEPRVVTATPRSQVDLLRLCHPNLKP